MRFNQIQPTGISKILRGKSLAIAGNRQARARDWRGPPPLDTSIGGKRRRGFIWDGGGEERGCLLT